MKFIAHRGLLNGPDIDKENNPAHITESLEKGYDCEIDVWYGNNTWFLGHDGPEYGIDFEFLKQPGLWIHAKNLDALYVLGADNTLNYFWHQNDDYTLTSQGYIWTYPGKPLSEHSICVMPENGSLEDYDFSGCGVCSDFIEYLKHKHEGKK
jgi:hypothetical protein